MCSEKLLAKVAESYENPIILYKKIILRVGFRILMGVKKQATKFQKVFEVSGVVDLFRISIFEDFVLNITNLVREENGGKNSRCIS
jgi:hypothetical protein